MEDVPGAAAPCPALQATPVEHASEHTDARARVAWLTLALSSPLGPVVCRRLRERYPDPTPLLERLIDATARGSSGHTALTRAARDSLLGPRGPLTPGHVAALSRRTTLTRVDETLAWLADDPLARIVTIDDPRYPSSLAATLDPPPVLFLRGALETLQGPAVALVGSRDATHGGLQRARDIAAELAASGIVVISGLALGMDAAVHAGALDSAGRTLAFVATGVDDVYPRRHRDLAAAMLAHGGALASEFPLRHPPQPWCFPQRNRLISGASLGVVVVEARLPSGSLTTARHALEQGREVMAIPGSVDNSSSAGCHQLIRDGALLVTCAGEVLHALATPLARTLSVASPTTPTRSPPAQQALDLTPRKAKASAAISSSNDHPAERSIRDALTQGGATLEQLHTRTGLATGPLLAGLARLELAGELAINSQGHYEPLKRI